MYSCPKTSTWITLKWMKRRGRWNISKGKCVKSNYVNYWWDKMCSGKKPYTKTSLTFKFKVEQLFRSLKFSVFFVPAGFAWILLGRPASGFPSTGQTSVWRKLRLLHIEAVSEWLSGHNQYLNSYTNPHVPPCPAHPFTSTQLSSSQNFSPAVPKTTPTLPCFVLVAVWFVHRPIWTDPPAELKQKWN